MAVTLTATELAAALSSPQALADRLLPVVTSLVEVYSTSAPSAVQNEAAIRCAGWMAEQPKGSVTRSTEGDISTSYTSTHLSALRHSGGMALLNPWKVRRAGVI